MAETIYIGDFESPGLKTDRTAFNIDNESFPYLFNFYVWRGRAKRKRGTQYLGQLTRQYSVVSLGNLSSGGAGTVTMDIFTILGIIAGQPGANIVPGTSTVPINITIGAPISQVLTDTLGTGTLTITGAGPITSATLNYGTGILSLVFSGAAAASAVIATFNYYPGLPVMGPRDLIISTTTQNFPNLIDRKSVV